MPIRCVGGFIRCWKGGRPTATLSGTTKVAGSPDAPVQRLVQLFTGANPFGLAFPNATMVGWRFSDAGGNWQFSNLDPAQTYHVIAYDHTGTYDPVVKLNLTPTP